MRNYLRVMYSVGRRAYSFDEILSLVLGHSVGRSSTNRFRLAHRAPERWLCNAHSHFRSGLNTGVVEDGFTLVAFKPHWHGVEACPTTSASTYPITNLNAATKTISGYTTTRIQQGAVMVDT